MTTNTAAAFIDSLLNNWVEGTKLTNTFAAAINTTDKVTEFDKIKTALSKLYLVFHIPQYSVNMKPTEFKNNTIDPVIKPTDRIFNYVYDENYNPDNAYDSNSKILLSKKGITKDNMIKLKMLLDQLTAEANESKAYDILITDGYPDIATINATYTLGGNNTNIRKNNKSNKKVKKLRKRNKSSKSLR